jgi:hypothetical protein
MGTIFVIVLEGIANPIPEKAFVPDSIAVFIPITSPLVSGNGPPELPTNGDISLNCVWY